MCVCGCVPVVTLLSYRIIVLLLTELYTHKHICTCKVWPTADVPTLLDDFKLGFNQCNELSRRVMQMIALGIGKVRNSVCVCVCYVCVFYQTNV